MRHYLLLLICLLLFSLSAISQYPDPPVTMNASRFCNAGTPIRISGSVFANPGGYNGYHFVGITFHFFSYAGVMNEIGTYTIYKPNSLITNTSSYNATYFDGTQITNPAVTAETYSSSAPMNGGVFSASFDLPLASFPNYAGIQFYLAVEGIDQSMNVIPVSNLVAFDNPIYYNNGVLTRPGILATKTLLCGSDQTTISTSPDLSSGFSYQWYKDGSSISGLTGPMLTTSSTGSYYAYIYDGCQNVSTDHLIISNGQVPIPPSITSDHGQLLCDGASANLFAISAGGAINWSNGATGSQININSAGTFTATETNGCGTSGSSNAIVFTTGVKPAAPVITPSANQLLCNGASVMLYSSGSNITWLNGATGNTVTTATPGSYYTFDQNVCGNSPNSNVVIVNTATCPMPAPGTAFQVCPGTLKTLDAGTGYDTYTWSNGATTQTIDAGAGTYHVAVTKNGCSNISNDVTVSYYTVVTPVITASGATTICAGSTVTLTSSPGSSYAWSTGASGQSINTGSGGGYYVTVTDNHGCPATSASFNIVINPSPTATVSGSVTVCQNASPPAIVFTGNNATAPYTFTYQVNGGANKSVTTSSGNTVPVNVPTTVNGTFVYSLVSVRESSGITCSSAASGSATVIVRQLPTAVISGSTSVCQNSPSPQIIFTGSLGNPPYTFTYRINGGTNQTVTSSLSNSTATLSVPTNIAGTYVYQLVNVQESSGVSCSNTVSGSASVVVNPLPGATLSGTTAVCQYAAAPMVRFIGAGATAPYTFQFTINGGSVQSVSTVGASASIDVAASTNVSGIFVYSLVSVQDKSSTQCLAAASGSVSITIHPQPAAAILKTPDSHLCNGASGQITVFNSVTGYQYSWYKDGGLLQTTTNASITNTHAGSFTVMMTSDKGCDAGSVSAPLIITTGSVAPPVITGSLQVCPGGKSNLIVAPFDTGQPYDQWRWMDSLNKTSLSRDSLFSAHAGQYHVNVRSQGCYDSTLVTVTPNDTAYPAGRLTLSSSSIPYGGQVVLSVNATNSYSYEWDLGDGTTVKGSANRLVQNYFVSGDSLPVKVTAVSERNCRSSFSSFLTVAPLMSDTIADLSKRLSMKDWNVFPTPFRDVLKVSMTLLKNESVRIEAFTADGAWVMSWLVAAKKGENLFALDRTAALAPNTLYLVAAIYNGKKHFAKIYKY